MAEKNHTSEVEDVPVEKDVQEVNSVSVKEEAREIDAALEKKVLRKADLRIVPILFTLFLLAFIDR